MSGGIAESGFVQLRGLPQWISLHGRDLANPVLIALHGGPGMTETPYFRHFNSAIESAFTVVYWDQRGTGRSHSPATPPESLTIDQLVRDLDDLVEHVRARLGKDRVALLGHSWGTVLGTLYAARHPEKVSAYIGTGQVGNLPVSEQASYAFVLAEAKRRGNWFAEARLRGIGPPPHTFEQVLLQRRWLTWYGRVFAHVPRLTMARLFLFPPGSSLLDFPKALRAAIFTGRAMWPEVRAVNLEVAAPALAVPVWFLHGRNDRLTDAGVAEAYFSKLSAPSKQLVWFESSGHLVPFEEPAAFNAAVMEIAAAVR
jgi:proline iminopeptidase